jgi:peptidoglycan/xylan/chitin deacetylase (PgdA/CDA1 family)
MITNGPRNRPWIALTFDADATSGMLARLRSGAHGGYDPRIVQTLRRTETPATMFVTGRWVERYPGVIAALAREPLFEIENRSYRHAAFSGPCFGLEVLDDSQKELEVIVGAHVIAAATGVRPSYFRFPGGCYDEADARLVARLGQQPVQWDVNSCDSFERDSGVIARMVTENAQPGSIVVMHLNGIPRAPATADALGRLIPALRKRGLEFVLLRRLLADL